jgi:hypothetical protein
LFLNRFAMALIDELVTSVLLVTAGCSAILLARHRPFLGFLSFSYFSFTYLLVFFLNLDYLYFVLLDTALLSKTHRYLVLVLLLMLLEVLWFGLADSSHSSESKIRQLGHLNWLRLNSEVVWFGGSEVDLFRRA